MNTNKLIRFDWAIKHLLRDKANFDILEGFLSAVLGRNVTVVNLLESESNKGSREDKLNRVDLLVELDCKERVLIEVQVQSELDFFQRIVFGTAKLITENLEAGKPYHDIKKVISISITYFNLGRGKDYLYYGSTNFVGRHTKDTLMPSPNQQKAFDVSDVKEIFPEHYVIRVEKFGDEVKDAIDEWIYMLKHSEVKPEFESDRIQAASEKLHYMSLDKKQQQLYRSDMENESYHNSMVWSHHETGLLKGREEGHEAGRKQGHKEGREEGREEGSDNRTMEIIKNSLEAGFSVEAIATITKMEVDHILQIKDELADNSAI